jgi:hypothetical protein
MEAESREWMDRCGACGYEQSVWDLGGIQWKAAGTSRQYRGCPNCGRRSWHTIYRRRADMAAPPSPASALPPLTAIPAPLAAAQPQPGRGVWIAVPLALAALVAVSIVALVSGGSRVWIVAPLAIVALVAVLGGVALLAGVIRDVGRAGSATGDYFAALIAHDWSAAQGYLCAAQRARNAPTDLAAAWAPGESAHGAATDFGLGSTSIANGTAQVDGTLRYRDGTAERWAVQLVKEGGGWRIAHATASAP